MGVLGLYPEPHCGGIMMPPGQLSFPHGVPGPLRPLSLIKGADQGGFSRGSMSVDAGEGPAPWPLQSKLCHQRLGLLDGLTVLKGGAGVLLPVWVSGRRPLPASVSVWVCHGQWRWECSPSNREGLDSLFTASPSDPLLTRI